MISWISQHSAALDTILSAAMTLIWVAYLQIFLVSYLRNRRSDILINVGAGVGLGARCFVSNLGLEPIYIVDVLVEIETKDGSFEAVITDRSELTEDQQRDPTHATNQGPMTSGGLVDIGSFRDLVTRTRRDDLQPEEDILSITVTVVAATAAHSTIVGACRTYDIVRDEDEAEGRQIQLHAHSISARQIRSWRGRRRLRERLRRRIGARAG